LITWVEIGFMNEAIGRLYMEMYREELNWKLDIVRNIELQKMLAGDFTIGVGTEVDLWEENIEVNEGRIRLNQDTLNEARSNVERRMREIFEVESRMIIAAMNQRML